MSEIMFQMDYEFLLSVLPVRQQKVVRMRSLGYTLQEISNELKECSRERVRQIEAKALQKMRWIFVRDGRR
jgi:DNA-directed RNA polymerase sigma subunit (sigma70/sigma32)